MKKFLMVLFLVSISLFLQGCTSDPEDSSDSSNENTPEETSNDDLGGQGPGSITMAQVESHNQANDCWMVISGKVYDVTEYVPSHPGEERITEGCGKDATELFNTQGGEGTHPQTARDILETYYIGDLTN